jgi:ArsR family transcriptional regulator, lead/cadmium/zinc/bismuth-responsive transcriptional repressor
MRTAVKRTELDSDIRIIDRRKVAATRAAVPSIGETDQLAEWFRTLGDPTRARILYALLEAGELCVCDLAATIDVSETSVSHALRWLRAGGVVRSRREGRVIHYTLDDAHVRQLLELGRAHLRHNTRVSE